MPTFCLAAVKGSSTYTLLLALSFIPFPTGLIGEYPRNPTGLALFAVVLMVAGIALNLMWRYAESRRLYHDGVRPDLIRQAKSLGVVRPSNLPRPACPSCSPWRRGGSLSGFP